MTKRKEMNDKISPIGATIICIVLALACFVGWHRLRLEKEARKFFKEASGANGIERRVLELEAKVAELERMARK